MMSEMDQARIRGTYLEYVNHMANLDLLVIDDFGLMDLDLDKCRDFFEVIDSRDNRKSTSRADLLYALPPQGKVPLHLRYHLGTA